MRYFILPCGALFLTNCTHSVYPSLFTPGKGLIWSYENVGHRRFASYDRLVRELLLPAAMNMPYEVAT